MNTLLCRIGLFVGLLFSSITSAQYSKLVVFGDSLSDTGNIASISLNFPYPFYRNRISNGPVAADFLATAIGSNADASLHLDNKQSGYNYAIGGANIKGQDREDLTAQIDSFLTRVQATADSSALYFVMLGGNDIRDVRSIASESIARNEIDSILDVLIQQLQRLIDSGARALLVPNVPNMGRLPETLQRQASDPGIVQRAQQHSQYFNQQLQQRLNALADKDRVSISQFDLYGELESLIANGSALGFRHVDIACFELDGFNFHPDCNFGTRFDRFVFFDNIHPSAKTNQIVSQALIQSLPAQPFRAKIVNVAPIIYLILGTDEG